MDQIAEQTAHFTYTQAQLSEMAADVLRVARELGATDAATEISEGSGLSVSVRKGQVETIEQNRDKVVGVTVMIGKRRGNASTSDFSPAALRATAEAAYNIARFTAEDECAGLAEEELLERAPADRRAKVLKHRLFLDGFAERHGSEDLRGEVSANPADPRARYRWGVMLAAGAQYQEALEELLESVRLDRKFADGAARKAALAIFDILGLDSQVTREYQRRLSNLLF